MEGGFICIGNLSVYIFLEISIIICELMLDFIIDNWYYKLKFLIYLYLKNKNKLKKGDKKSSNNYWLSILCKLNCDDCWIRVWLYVCIFF